MVRDLLSRRRTRDGRAGQCRSMRTHGARALAVAALLSLTPAAWGLGLGDIELDSALNEKLDAEIELLDAAGLQPTEIIVSLASADDFERVGVERFFFLTDLRFEVDFGGGGVRNVKVTSTQPVTEPYLNFLVEVLWPSGRLLKEYTLLLDPPTFSPAPAPSVSAPARARDGDSSAGQVERSATVSRGTQVQLAPGRAVQPSPLDEGVVDGEYRMTDRTDTLWSIASRTRPSRAVTVQQTMLAIQRLNPQAFLHDNINLLKAGYALRLPTEQQAASVTASEANQQVAMQDEDWRALRRGEPVAPRGEQQLAVAGESAEPELQARMDATPAQGRVNPGTGQREGELRIIAGAGDGQGGVVGAEQLDAALEEQDRLGREVDALTEELDREREIASNQIAVKDRQLEVKDQQIAEMQAEMQRLQEEMQRMQTAAAEQRQNQSVSDAGAWWQSPYVLGGALGAVVLLLVYALIVARRRRSTEDDVYSGMAAEVTAVQSRRQPGMAVAAAAPALEDDETLREEDAPAAPPRPSVTRADASEDAGAETGDVIGEADIYIAYGRYPQAISLLLGVLEEDPGRNDVRLKLLELYAETRDREAFDAHMAELVERCEDDEALLTARELGAQFGEDSSTRAVEDVLESADEAVVSRAQELLAEARAPLPDRAGVGIMTAAGASTAGAPGGGDFELELDGLGDEEAIASEGMHSRHTADELGGDLGLDFDPDHQGNGEAHAEAARAGDPETAGAGSDLDLDLDLDGPGMLEDDAFDFEDQGDTAGTKLDLARAYIDMGDHDGARDILNEVVAEGNAEQQKRAQAMLEEL